MKKMSIKLCALLLFVSHILVAQRSSDFEKYYYKPKLQKNRFGFLYNRKIAAFAMKWE